MKIEIYSKSAHEVLEVADNREEAEYWLEGMLEVGRDRDDLELREVPD